jgi:hypothetical protein
VHVCVLADQTALLLKHPERGAFIADELFVLWLDDDAFFGGHGRLRAPSDS